MLSICYYKSWQIRTLKISLFCDTKCEQQFFYSRYSFSATFFAEYCTRLKCRMYACYMSIWMYANLYVLFSGVHQNTFIFVLQFLVRKWMLLGVFCIFFFTLLSSFLSLWFACLALSHTLSEIYEKCESVIVTILIFWRKVFFFALPIQL